MPTCDRGSLTSNKPENFALGLTKESQLYGAMDGAMKFVKGDAIAGIVIAAINIIGGLIIGVMMHGMSLGQSAKIYTLLSIGDGLVSQIPALMIAITAGIVTTRVSSEKKDAHLGKEISEQLLKQPKALMIAGGVLLLMAAIPGFPAWVFLFMSLIVGTIGFVFWHNSRRVAAKAVAGVSAVESEVPGIRWSPEALKTMH
jgi:type III secretion protein V